MTFIDITNDECSNV